MNSNILSDIESKMSAFSKGQKNIADFILNHYEKAAYMTAAKLGVAAGVSESTVVRFAFELGYEGYPQLQLDLQEMIKNKLTSIQRIELANERLTDSDILSKVMNIDIEKIKRTLNETSREHFNGAVDSLINAKNIYIVAAGSSSVLARFMALYFNIMFDNVKLIATFSESEMFEQIMRISKGDIMIGISFPRYSKKNAKAMEYANHNGAKVIAITDSPSSPIVKHADYFLQAQSEMASFVDSLVAPLSLINALIVAIGLKKHDELQNTFDKLEGIWDEYDVYQKAEDNSLMAYDVIIIGAGPAGMMAAITASENGKKALLLDKNARLGRKLLITGKGRCNVTNNCSNEEFMKNIPNNPKFLYSAINKFSTEDTMNFFEWRNVPLKTERGNRVFPESDKAFDIEKALEDECSLLEVDIKVGEAVEILTEDGAVTGVKCKDGEYSGKSVIIATGGKSYPLTGSTGDGYKMAKALGHTVTNIIPSLVPFVSDDVFCPELQGLSLRNVELSLFEAGAKKPIFKELGEMLFTHYGISGPLVLSASSHIKEIKKGRYFVSIDLKPGLDEKKLDQRIIRDFQTYQNKEFANGLSDLLPKKLIPIVVERSGISGNIKINQITKEQRQNLVSLIKGFTVSVDGYRPIDEAIVTSGGINTDEINPRTMESKLVKGLYFAGEVIDVDGYTGGFNLQIAFSTGYVAGLNC